MRFDSLLVANRGEIACRIIRSARRARLRTIAVYSDADRDAPHVRLADVAVHIGAAPPAESYLNPDVLLEAARRTGASAVHPGYGFLSENAGFARACADAGLVFVGPEADAIEALGNKTAAKQVARRLGVPCLPGADERDADGTSLAEHARRIGAPLMIKAAAGGGGRGMRRVESLDAFEAQLRSARTEAASAFGSDEMLIERLLVRARHVEVQIIGDEHGNYLHLGERDCSTQRRSQKILEESPAPGVDATLRTRLGEAAVALARGVGYRNAGTVEFLLAEDGQFYFLEMNTRLQVEHPVTEAVTGIDLVDWQIRVAQGEALPVTQDSIAFDGWAIEARLCAENPYQGFAPQPGPIAGWTMPDGEGVRCDHGLGPRARVPAQYDSMLAKIIVHAPSREQARLGLIDALHRTHIHGPITNRDFLIACLRDSAFAQPSLSVGWLDDADLAATPPAPSRHWIALAGALLVEQRANVHRMLAHWSSTGPVWTPMSLRIADEDRAFSLRHVGPGCWNARVDDVEFAFELASEGRVRIGGVEHDYDVLLSGAGGSLDAFGYAFAFTDAASAPKRRDAGGSGEITARMHGLLGAVHVDVGDRVGKGAPLFSVEAMKMSHRTDAPFDATVIEVCVRAGQQVSPDQLLVRLEPLESEATQDNGDKP